MERDSEGKEVRYPVILNAREKLIAWRVCLAFKVRCYAGHIDSCKNSNFFFLVNEMLFGLITGEISRENKVVYLNGLCTFQGILVVPLILKIYNK